jgi:hypothetical protein
MSLADRGHRTLILCQAEELAFARRHVMEVRIVADLDPATHHFGTLTRTTPQFVNGAGQQLHFLLGAWEYDASLQRQYRDFPRILSWLGD